MNKDRSGIVPRDALESMSTAMLQEILDRELDVETPADVNVERIKEITTILNARTGKSEIDVDAKYDELISEHLNAEMLYPEDEEYEAAPVIPLRRKKRLGRVLLIAAVIVVLLAGTVQVSGLNIWKVLAQWTEETFKFNVVTEEPAREGDERFAELRRVLTEEGVPPTIIPRFMSEGYVYQSIESGRDEFCAIYANGEESLCILIHPIQTGNASRIEKNDTKPEVYVVNGIEHHIVANLELYSATWVNGGYECTIYGIPTIEDTYKMIDSIYWED